MKNATEEPRTKTHSKEEQHQKLFFLEEQTEERTMKHHQLIYFFYMIFFSTNAAFRLWFHTAPGARVVELYFSGSIRIWRFFEPTTFLRKLFTKTLQIVFFFIQFFFVIFQCFIQMNRMYLVDTSEHHHRLHWTEIRNDTNWNLSFLCYGSVIALLWLC